MNMKIQIDLFGRVAVRCGDVIVVNFPTRKVAELLLILAVHADQANPRSNLIKLLWPDARPDKSCNRLAATLYLLRKTLEAHLGDTGAQMIQSGDGAIQLRGNIVTDLDIAEQIWNEYSHESDAGVRSQYSQQLRHLYRGHLGTKFKSAWCEPLQAIWASRWTECIIWDVVSGSLNLDDALALISKMQPVLPITRSRVVCYLEDLGRFDLASTWRSDRSFRSGQWAQVTGDLTDFEEGEISAMASRCTVTSLVVESHVVPILQEFIKQSDGMFEKDGHPQVLSTRNPLIARRIASRIRQRHPLARLYITTQVCDGALPQWAPLIDYLAQMEAGETLMNSAAAALIDISHRNGVSCN